MVSCQAANLAVSLFIVSHALLAGMLIYAVSRHRRMSPLGLILFNIALVVPVFLSMIIGALRLEDAFVAPYVQEDVEALFCVVASDVSTWMPLVWILIVVLEIWMLTRKKKVQHAPTN